MTGAPSTRTWGRLASGAVVVLVMACLVVGTRALRGGDATTLWILLWILALVALGVAISGRAQLRRHARSLDEHTAMLEQLASELARANRTKGQFLSSVSHELRTPLSAIVGFVEMLRDGTYGDLTPRQASPVERIETSANHLQGLVEDILDLSKLAAARMDVQHEPIALHAFVIDVATEMEPLVTEKKLALSIGVGATLPRLRTDPTHLRQIIVNLFGNAIKYTPSGQIAIRARLIDGSGSEGDRAQIPARLPAAHGVWIALSVHDTGIGISSADQDRVFEEFEQVNAGPRGDSEQRGTGLGLAIARRLARLLNGDITLDSALEHGATFTLWLPVDPADLAPPLRAAAAVTALPPRTIP